MVDTVSNKKGPLDMNQYLDVLIAQFENPGQIDSAHVTAALKAASDESAKTAVSLN